MRSAGRRRSRSDGAAARETTLPACPGGQRLRCSTTRRRDHSAERALPAAGGKASAGGALSARDGDEPGRRAAVCRERRRGTDRVGLADGFAGDYRTEAARAAGKRENSLECGRGGFLSGRFGVVLEQRRAGKYFRLRHTRGRAAGGDFAECRDGRGEFQRQLRGGRETLRRRALSLLRRRDEFPRGGGGYG